MSFLNYAIRRIEVTNKSREVNEQTSKLKWGAKKMEAAVIWRQYAPFVVLGTVILLLIVVKFAF